MSSLSSFLLAMLLYPGVQTRAQLELDNKCCGRLPEFPDRERLSYVNALLCDGILSRLWVSQPYRELASSNGFPGLPHMATSDDIYRGYFIPAGTIVVGMRAPHVSSCTHSHAKWIYRKHMVSQPVNRHVACAGHTAT